MPTLAAQYVALGVQSTSVLCTRIHPHKPQGEEFMPPIRNQLPRVDIATRTEKETLPIRPNVVLSDLPRELDRPDDRDLPLTIYATSQNVHQ